MYGKSAFLARLHQYHQHGNYTATAAAATAAEENVFLNNPTYKATITKANFKWCDRDRNENNIIERV